MRMLPLAAPVAIATLVVASPLLTACGYLCPRAAMFCTENPDDEDAGPPVVAVVHMTTLDDAPTDQSYDFTSVATCDHDPDSGLLSVRYPGHDRQLALEIRDFKAQPDSYRCQQAADNNLDAASAGDRYETCLVEVTTPGATGVGLDSYAMHRHTAQVKRFAYDGDCTIRVDRADGRLAGAVSCTRMAQVTQSGLARNPIATDDVHADRTASFDGSFGCDLVEKALPTPADPTPEPPPPEATATVQTSDGRAGTVVMERATTCTVDPETGVFHALWNGKLGQLELALRDYQATSSRAYACVQTPDNATDAAAVGDLYETCMVEARFAPAAQDKVSGFAMHRKDTSVKRFRYEDSCVVTLEERDGDALGSVQCQRMAETLLAGQPRNPVATDQIHADVTADVTAAFRCRIQR
jgi:hypothetical protein